MRNTIPLILAALIAVAIIVIGCFYWASPKRVLGSFGLKPPAPDADTHAWLRLKGIRDVAAGLVADHDADFSLIAEPSIIALGFASRSAAQAAESFHPTVDSEVCTQCRQ